MLLSMSRSLVAGVLGTTFAVGGVTGWFLHRPAGDGPTLAATAADGSAPPREGGLESGQAPRNPARPVPVVKSAPTPGHFVRLSRQDTLSEIAHKAYGSTKRLPDLLAANPGLEPTRLTPGTLVYVPVGRERASAIPAEAVPARGGPPPIFAPR